MKIYKMSEKYGKEITIETLALEMARNGSKIVYCDIECVLVDDSLLRYRVCACRRGEV